MALSSSVSRLAAGAEVEVVVEHDCPVLFCTKLHRIHYI